MQGEYTTHSKSNQKVVNAVLNLLRMDASEQKARLDLISRQRELFKRGHISQAECEQAYLYIDRQLQSQQSPTQPEALFGY